MEICAECHLFYTGAQKLVDTAVGWSASSAGSRRPVRAAAATTSLMAVSYGGQVLFSKA